MDLERLREIHSEEMNSEKLKLIEPNFYEEVAEYISRLRKKIEELREYDVERDILEDEIRSARRVVEDIFKLRLRKIIRSANFKANGLDTELEGLTREEEELYNELVNAITKARRRVLSCLSGKVEEVEEEKKIYSMEEKDRREEELKTSGNEASEELEDTEGKGYILVKVVKEIPPFVGIDGRSYSLKREDVVTLPREHAELLLQRNVITLIKMR